MCKLIFFILLLFRSGAACELPGFEKSLPTPKLYDITLNDRLGCRDGLPDGNQPFNRVNSTEKIETLIDSIIAEGYDAYIVSSTDPHQSEITASPEQRTTYLTGFIGNPAFLVVLATGERAVWTPVWFADTADQQFDCTWLVMQPPGEAPTVAQWLRDVLESGSVVGADAQLFGADQWRELDRDLSEAGISLEVETLIGDDNIVEQMWNNDGRPSYRTDPVIIHDITLAGVSWETKVSDLVKEITSYGADAAIFTELDEIAWLFNLRGSDIDTRPVFRSFVILDATASPSRVHLFIPDVETKVSEEVETHLGAGLCGAVDPCVELHEYDDFDDGVDNITSMASKIFVPNAYSTTFGVSYYIYTLIPESMILSYRSPLLIMKAGKNDAEQTGMQNAHIRDAVALIAFLADLDQQVASGGNITEFEAQAQLTSNRAAQENFVSIAFFTTTAFGPHGGQITFLPLEPVNSQITDQDVYLLDSGGQYLDGTTDVTRTLHFGTPSDYHKDVYTRILQGHIEYASAVFPQGTTRTSVEVLARKFLYEVGLDYVLFTSHGIGAHLNHREAPPDEFMLGNHISDEPGYYEAGNFGMRIENILRVVDVTTKYNYTTTSYGFEPVTLVPYEPKLMDLSLLTSKQCNYVNNYHLRVRDVIGPELLSQGYTEAYDWMVEKTEPLTCS